MSCNGCRVLRKGCSDSCILRPCIQWIDTPEAQGHATVFVAKFFGRAGLMSFISAVPEIQRPALFRSLLFEACGRTVNPVNGAVGLLWTGKWHVCQAAVETVLRGGTLRAMPHVLGGETLKAMPHVLRGGTVRAMPQLMTQESDQTLEDTLKLQETATYLNTNRRFSSSRSKVSVSPERMRVEDFSKFQPSDLDLCLTGKGVPYSLNSEEYVTTTICFESGFADQQADKKLLNLFD